MLYVIACVLFCLIYIQATPAKQQRREDCASQSVVRDLQIIDLPEEVVRRIFSFMADAELYFNVRCVSRQLRHYVEDYVQIGKSIYT